MRYLYYYIDNLSFVYRTKKNSSKKLACRMAGIDGKGMASDICSGTMIYEPILEKGVFRFDCSSDDRNAAFPSLSFVNPRVRDTPLMSEKLPSYIPTFECTLGQQIVHLQVHSCSHFLYACYLWHVSLFRFSKYNILSKPKKKYVDYLKRLKILKLVTGKSSNYFSHSVFFFPSRSIICSGS